MSLYHEAAQILTTATEDGGSLKSIIFGKREWKTDRKTLFALSTEAAKWSEVLSEVIERSEVLKTEKQVFEARNFLGRDIADFTIADSSAVSAAHLRSPPLKEGSGFTSKAWLAR